MEREELIERFIQEFRYYNVPLTESAIKYVKGEIDELGGITLTSPSCRRTLNFFYFVVKELNGKNDEIAKRMLRTIYYADEKLITAYYYINQESVKISAIAGVEFEDLFKNIFSNSRIFTSLDEAYELSEIFYKYYKEKVIKYTEDLIEYDTNDLLKRKYSELYITLTFAQVIYFNDKENNKIYLDKCIECLKNMKFTKEVTILFIRIINESEEITTLIKDKILNEPDFGAMVCTIVGTRNYLNFLKKNNIPIYPYYALFATNYYFGEENKGKIFNKLYKDDRETFFNAYKYLSKVPKSGIYCLNLLSIMCNDGYALEECKKQKFKLMKYSEEIISLSSSRKNPYQAAIEGKESMKNSIKKVFDSYSIAYGSYSNLIKIFSVYYDYEENARKFIDFIIDYVAEEKRFKNMWHLFSYFVFSRKEWLNKDIKESVEFLLNRGFNYNDLFLISCLDMSYEDFFTKDMIRELCKGHEEEALNFLDDYRATEDTEITIKWLKQLYDYNGVKDYKPILKLVSSKSKKIRNFCEKIILENEESTRKGLEEMMPKLKGHTLMLAKRVIKQWDNERKYGKGFEFKSDEIVIEFVDDNYDIENESLVKWIDDSEISNAKFKDSKKHVPTKVIRYIIMEYMALSEPYKIQICDKIIEKININDIQDILENVYQKWLGEGADTKKKNITIPYAIYASDNQILNLRKQIEDWAKVSRGAIAAYTVNSIALNGGKVALLMIDEISRKFPNAMVKKAAKKAFSYAAKVLNIPEDELSDKIVPTLDFNKEGEKILDYGPRSFKINLMPDFTLSIFDESKNKVIKSLPKPNEKDDIEKAESAKKEFTYIKKQIKAIVQTQKYRLEKALMDGRTWSKESFSKLFVENPIMHIFAEGLIWGVYEDGKLKESFRYMEDGTFNTIDEEEYEISDDSKIALVHPVDLSEEELELWTSQLEDYEILQPINQLKEEIIKIKDEDLDGKAIIKFKDKKTTVGNLLSVAKKNNMIRGDIYDGGGYESYHIIDDYLNLGVKISFEDMYVGAEFDEEIDMNEVIFYKFEGEEIDDDIKENRILNPKNISQRFVSSVLNIINSINFV